MNTPPKNDDARRQAGEVGKANHSQLAFSFGDQPAVKPVEPSGQCVQVLNLIRSDGPILSLTMTADHAIPEAAARVHDLRAMGWNIITTIHSTVIFRGVERRNVASYSLGVPEWVSPRQTGRIDAGLVGLLALLAVGTLLLVAGA